jgi:hypothetical protein
MTEHRHLATGGLFFACTLAAAISRNARAQVPIASRAAYSWTAANSSAGGTFQNCGDPPFGNCKVEIKEQLLRGVPERGETQWEKTVILNLKPLRPDGSGRISVKAPRGRTWHFDFEPGTGPRKIHIRRDPQVQLLADSEIAPILCWLWRP